MYPSRTVCIGAPILASQLNCLGRWSSSEAKRRATTRFLWLASPRLQPRMRGATRTAAAKRPGKRRRCETSRDVSGRVAVATRRDAEVPHRPPSKPRLSEREPDGCVGRFPISRLGKGATPKTAGTSKCAAQPRGSRAGSARGARLPGAAPDTVKGCPCAPAGEDGSARSCVRGGRVWGMPGCPAGLRAFADSRLPVSSLCTRPCRCRRHPRSSLRPAWPPGGASTRSPRGAWQGRRATRPS